MTRLIPALFFWAAAFTAGYCFGGQTGVGIVAVLAMIVQVAF